MTRLGIMICALCVAMASGPATAMNTDTDFHSGTNTDNDMNTDTVDVLGALPLIRDVKIAPDGRHIAVIQQGAASAGAIIYPNRDGQAGAPALIAPDNAEITAIAWATNDRLLVAAREAGAPRRGGGIVDRTQIISVRPDGSDAVILQQRITGLAGRDNPGPSANQGLLALLPAKRNKVLISAEDRDGAVNVYEAEIRSGTASLLEEGIVERRAGRQTIRWQSTVDGSGLLRWTIDAADDPAFMVVDLRRPGRTWQTIQRYDLALPPPARIVSFGARPDEIYAIADNENGVPSLYEYDIEASKPGRLVLAPGSGAVTGIEMDRATGALAAIQVTDDERALRYLSPARTELKALVDRSFGATSVNRILSSTADGKLHVLATSGPSVPRSFYLFDSGAMTARRIGDAYPTLEGSTLSPVRAFTYKTRDGLALRAYLTATEQPDGQDPGPAPLVVLIHDGPSRGVLPDLDPQGRRVQGFATITPDRVGIRASRRTEPGDRLARLIYIRTAIISTIRFDDFFGGRSAPAVPELNRQGGTEGRAVMAFDYLAQFLASRGYAVLTPNFRGSEGFGQEIRAAGQGEWGRAMQSDLADAIAHVGREGWADTARVCLAGQGYGGYAALMGVTAPGSPGAVDGADCAIAVAPIADLDEAIGESDGPYAEAFWEGAFGPDWNSRGVREDLSPVARAGDIAAPVLLIHGQGDTTVPFVQSETMADALREAGGVVDLIRLDTNRHGLAETRPRQQALRAMDAFLTRYLPGTDG